MPKETFAKKDNKSTIFSVSVHLMKWTYAHNNVASAIVMFRLISHCIFSQKSLDNKAEQTLRELPSLGRLWRWLNMLVQWGTRWKIYIWWSTTRKKTNPGATAYLVSVCQQGQHMPLHRSGRVQSADALVTGSWCVPCNVQTTDLCLKITTRDKQHSTRPDKVYFGPEQPHVSCFVLYYYSASLVDIEVHASRPKLKELTSKLTLKNAMIKKN